MSFTLAALIAAAALVALEAISNFARENRGTFNALLKQSKLVVYDMNRKLESELNKYENSRWKND